MPKVAAHPWQFRARFRKGAFGWRGSRPAIERIAQAIAEIRKVARRDPILGAEGAIAFLERVSPALEQVDSSSGALGRAVNSAIAELVPILSLAQATETLRCAWLERLWAALSNDLIPYIESLGDHWGELCVTPVIAARWADELLPATIASFSRVRGLGRYFHGTTVCMSAMLRAGRYHDLLDLVERAPSFWWHYRCWGFRALLAQGKRGEALRYAEASRDASQSENVPVAVACEEVLLGSGMAEAAYERYAIAASAYEPTNLARLRSISKKYPAKPAHEILRDLVAATPGNEGKWFAAAKSLGLYDEAIALAQSTPCDPKTLARAARDFAERRPQFARDAALTALRWLCKGYGYEVTNIDVIDAYRHGLRAAKILDATGEYIEWVAQLVATGDSFVRESLRYDLEMSSASARPAANDAAR